METRDEGRDLVLVTIEFDSQQGIEYALNGSARDFGYPELDTDVWNGDRAATLPFIDLGLTLCD